MTLLRQLPNLRSITAPEQAFFSVHDHETFALPATIESIGLIDSKCENAPYIKHILKHQGEWPNLKLIKLHTGKHGSEIYEDIVTNDNINNIIREYIYHFEFDDECCGWCNWDEGPWRELFKLDYAIFKGAQSSDVRVEIIRDSYTWRKEWTGSG